MMEYYNTVKMKGPDLCLSKYTNTSKMLNKRVSYQSTWYNHIYKKHFKATEKQYICVDVHLLKKLEIWIGYIFMIEIVPGEVKPTTYNVFF